jgi:carboxypeptidase Q
LFPAFPVHDLEFHQAESLFAPAANDPYAEVQPATETLDLGMYQRIRDEGLNHSHVMEFGTALMDGIGPRLTGSPNLAKANAWTRDTLTKIGLENAHLEDWGEFGLGWQQLNTWARMVTPDTAVLIVQATPWSPSTPGPVTGDVVFVSIQTEKDFDSTRASWRARWFFSAPCARCRRWTSRCLSATPTRNWKTWPSSR